MTQDPHWLTVPPSARLRLGVVLCCALTGATACPSSEPPEDPDPSTTDAPSTTGSTTSDGTTTQDADTSSSTAMVDESSGGTSTGDTGVEIELDGMCPLETRVGSFLLAAEPEYSSFAGSVADGVVPVSILEPVGAEGDCILLRRNNPFCKPLCSPGQTCDFDGSCIPYPQNHDVGTVAITGLLEPLMIDPVAPTFVYFDTTLMHPPFVPEAALELTSTGGDYSSFVLHGFGVPAVEPAADELSLSIGAPLTVEWSPIGSMARLRLVLRIDQHGLTPVQLVCETDDTGSLEIPAALIDQLLDFGVSGFPQADYYLQTADSVEIEPGCVEFVVYSHVQTTMNVDGHTPCDDPGDCPAGQMCDFMIQTCV